VVGPTSLLPSSPILEVAGLGRDSFGGNRVSVSEGSVSLPWNLITSSSDFSPWSANGESPRCCQLCMPDELWSS
jgi:hypothetical protein